MSNPFDDNRLYGARSALVEMTPDDQGRFQFELWSQYTRLGLDGLQVGDLVAVENYTPTENGRNTYSVLTLNQVYPIHFAAQGTDAYPGHIFESMRSIKEDWEKQTDKPLHPTTTIKSRAISTGWQFKYSSRDEDLPILGDEKNLPMVGAEIMPLSMEMVNSIINRNMEQQPPSPFLHKKFADINVKLDKEALLTTHFGIFGFTGVGKSNLVSSMVTSLSSKSDLEEEIESDIISNVVLIDPNDEYLGLLIDKFVSNPEEIQYVHVGADSLAYQVTQILGNTDIGKIPIDKIEDAIDTQLRQMKLPGALKHNPNIQIYIREGLKKSLARTSIGLTEQNIFQWIQNKITEQTPPQSGPEAKDVLREIATEWAKGLDQSSLNTDVVQQAINREPSIRPIIGRRLRQNSSPLSTVTGVVDRTLNSLRRLKKDITEIPPNAIISYRDVISALNDEKKHQIFIITGRRDSDLKRFIENIGNELYESRRREGRIKPFTVFLFDEADLFIPIDSKDEETERIKELCVTLARRGRKFGLGIGISTQRASLLDTEVMGNLHTYFVSKLPRSNDRQRVAEAFGIGEDQLSPTFTFRPGDWLIISHDATGLKGVPIPVSASNANERILEAARKAQ